jgi:hypothetical protein
LKCRGLLIVLPLAAVLLAYACSNTASLSDVNRSSSQAAYPDTDVGFGAFINELVDAHAGTSNPQSRMHSLVIPDSSHWFIQEFGPAVGPTLDFQYRYQVGWQFARLYSYLPIYARGQNRLVRVEHCEQGCQLFSVTNSSLIPLAAWPLRIYSASIAQKEEGPWMKVGSFVYVNGSFRLMGALDSDLNWNDFKSYDKPFEP